MEQMLLSEAANAKGLSSMKKHWKSLCTMILGLALVPAMAQTGAQPAKGRPSLTGPTDKLFVNNVSYSGIMEVQTGRAKAVVSKVFVDQGASRHDLDLAAELGKQIPPDILAEMRRTGMGKFIMLWRPDKNIMYQVYPGVKGYLEMPMPTRDVPAESEYRLETTQLGKEKLDGHRCIKLKAVVTGPRGQKREYIVWNATDLNDFPIKIQTTTALGEPQTILYRKINLARPDPQLLELPGNYRKYSDLSSLMQAMMDKQFSSARL